MMIATCYWSTCSFAGGFCLPLPAAGLVVTPLVAYVGPGAGLTMLGSLFAVTCVILLALLGPLIYPLRWFRSWLRRRGARRALGSFAHASEVALRTSCHSRPCVSTVDQRVRV